MIIYSMYLSVHMYVRDCVCVCVCSETTQHRLEKTLTAIYHGGQQGGGKKAKHNT